jgi:hypothetical protein
MANEIPNAVTLRRDNDFRDWVIACIGYQARLVLTESTGTNEYEARRRLAAAAILDPAQFGDRMVNVLATDPAIASQGDTVQLVTQELLISKVAEVWTPLAKLLYPDPA